MLRTGLRAPRLVRNGPEVADEIEGTPSFQGDAWRTLPGRFKGRSPIYDHVSDIDELECQHISSAAVNHGSIGPDVNMQVVHQTLAPADDGIVRTFC